MFDPEEIVFETLSRHTGVDPAEFSMKTKLRGTRDLRRPELEAVIVDIEETLGQQLAGVAELATVGELVDLVDKLGSK